MSLAKHFCFSFLVSITLFCNLSLASRDEIPASVNQAVELLKTKWLKVDDLDRLLHMPKDAAVSELHMSFGTAVRNSWNLWKGNSELLASCGVPHHEGCSGVIFERLWEDLRSHSDPKLVASLDCQFQLSTLIQIKVDGFYKMQIGEVLKSIQRQIDGYAARADLKVSKCSDPKIILKPMSSPNLTCWTRAEFSKEGAEPLTLERLLGWISWRNGFSYRYNPPYLELPFHKPCAWPELPRHFWPEDLHNHFFLPEVLASAHFSSVKISSGIKLPSSYIKQHYQTSFLKPMIRSIVRLICYSPNILKSECKIQSDASSWVRLTS